MEEFTEPTDNTEEQALPTYEELLTLYSKPAIFIYPQSDGDVTFSTNITQLGPHEMLGFLVMTQTRLSTEIMAAAMQRRAAEQARADLLTNKIIVPR